ncbi:hypothetical protein OG250_08910 [Streptomyces sp. NBC_00487]|uniref:hypothetical protein n=1 Tax=unclassified Streptomyces TaxID=2593676 RepID=UPI002DDB2247|nr:MULTISPECIES: hypothetical protein [unclassified Streptomyces]WRY94989.1 hypothetical protein OG889_09780 [Streptomyces sp. NBC_00481]
MSGDTPRTEAGAPPLPQGPQSLPRRPRNTPPAPPPGEDTAEAPGADDDAQDTLCPDDLARAMVAIRWGSTRARLAGPDDTDGPRTPRPGPGAA